MAKMTVEVLGASNAWAAPESATSGYFVRCDGSRVLIDCGHGVLSKLRTVAAPEELDAVVLSHLHADHCADLVSMVWYLLYHPHSRPGVRVKLFVPEGEIVRLQQIMDVFDAGDAFEKAFDVQEVNDKVQVPVGEDLVLSFAWVPHSLPTLAVKAWTSDGSARFVYGADCGVNDELVHLAADADVLVIEATMPEASEDHLSALEAGRIAARARAKACVLTHVCDAFDPVWVLEQGAAGFGDRVTIARDGMTFEI